jgi:transposase-like protein
MSRKSRAKSPSPFRCFNSSREVIRLAVLMYVKYPLSLRNVEDLLHERGIDICHETVRFWCWVGRLPTASRCARVSSLKDSIEGDRPWRRLHALGWTRQRVYSSCMA